MARKKWFKSGKNFDFTIEERIDGKFFAQLDKHVDRAVRNICHGIDTMVRLEEFEKVEDALLFLGWPVDIAGIPAELQ